MLSFIPFLVLIVLITCCVAVFGNATLDGASQVSLLVASAVSVVVGHFSKRLEWENLEKEITDKISSCTPAIIILLLIGAIGGTWMVSGIVPTMIYYGMQIIRPEIFLVSSSLLCALVSLMIGSSWTTVATIGLALMGIGKAAINSRRFQIPRCWHRVCQVRRSSPISVICFIPRCPRSPSLS